VTNITVAVGGIQFRVTAIASREFPQASGGTTKEQLPVLPSPPELAIPCTADSLTTLVPVHTSPPLAAAIATHDLAGRYEVVDGAILQCHCQNCSTSHTPLGIEIASADQLSTNNTPVPTSTSQLADDYITQFLVEHSDSFFGATLLL
jgi:hypothetical protein